MQQLAELCIRRPIFASMLVLALAVVGAASYFRLGVDRLPSVDLPIVAVRTTIPGASSEDVEAEVTEPIEEAVNTVAGLQELRSISGSETSLVIATFALERDIDSATQDIRDRIQGVLSKLPPGTDPPMISKQDNDGTPVLTIALSANRPLRELTELAQRIVSVQLARASGVGEVRVVGGQERAIAIALSAERLQAYGLPVTAVRDAIASQNVNIPGGNVTSPRHEETLRTMGRLTEAREFDDLVVATRNGAPVRVRDIGRAEDGTYEQRSIARLDDVPTVILEVRRQSGANTVAVIDSAKENMARVASQLPSDVRLEVVRDQSQYIHAALHEINWHLVLGSILACLVVLAFMRSWRSTLIAGIAIPASVISTFFVMRALNFTLNSVTMLALTLMIGIVIDDAIVVLENIFRFVEERNMDAFDAARAATAEIGLAVLATTLSLVVIFLPVSFMSSVSGRFLYQFGVTAAVAVAVSLLVSFTLTPMMSARLLRGERASQSGAHRRPVSRGGLYGRLDSGYQRLLEVALRHRGFVAAIAAVVMLSALPLYRVVHQEFLPSNVDESEFEVGVTAPLDISLAEMDDVMRTVSAELHRIGAVRSVLVQAGGSPIGGVNSGHAAVQLVSHEERTFSIGRLVRATLAGHPGRAFENLVAQSDVIVAARAALKKYKDLRCSVRNIPSFNIGGGNFEIDFAILGPDLERLAGYSEALRARAEQIGGIADGEITLHLDRPERRVIIDRERAADLGVRTLDIATAVRLMVGGDEEVSRFRDEALNANYNVQLRLFERERNSIDPISRLFVPRASPSAPLVRLDSLVKIEPAQSPSRIDRLDRQRVSSLRAGVGPGFALADRLDALRVAAAELHMPSAYSSRVMGRGRELERTFSEFVWAFLLSIVFMYMILASQFESLIHPLTILLALPLSVPFALLSLWATGNTLNLYSALGMLVLFGVVKKNSILQVDHMNRLRSAGMPRELAILTANRDRLRPILMTTLALVAGMLPLWLGNGPGAEERRAIAVVVIGGQSLSLLLTLVVTPIVYSLLDDLAMLRKRPPSADPVAVSGVLLQRARDALQRGS